MLKVGHDPLGVAQGWANGCSFGAIKKAPIMCCSGHVLSLRPKKLLRLTYHLAVAPTCRRQGIGRALVEACLAALASAGIPKCNIFLLADNELGKAFWKHNGWNERDDLKVLQKQTPLSSDEDKNRCACKC
jgi:GNAT superfamily N-acetyltransferase